MSVASSPRRRRRSPPSVSSAPSFRLPRSRSCAARRRPAPDTPGQRNTSPMSPGMPNGASFANATRPRSVHRYAPLAPGDTSSPASPSSRQRSTAHGLRATNESAPVSRRTSPTIVLPSLPPARSDASRTVTSTPAAASRYAVVKPETPPPITTTRPASLISPAPPPGAPGRPRRARRGTPGRRSACAVRSNRAPACSAIVARLDVQVVEDLQVIGDEAGGAHDHGVPPRRRELLDHRLDRRSPPRVVRPAGALPRDEVVVQAEPFADQVGRLLQPVAVPARVVAVARLAPQRAVVERPDRQRVRGEDHASRSRARSRSAAPAPRRRARSRRR